MTLFPRRFRFRAAGAEPLPELGVQGGPRPAQAVLPSLDSLGIQSPPRARLWDMRGTRTDVGRPHTPWRGPHVEVGFFLSVVMNGSLRKRRYWGPAAF